MDSKLTLKLDEKAIRKAKAYARNRKTSLSRLVESFFDSVSEPSALYNIPLPPLVRELSGSVKLPKDYDEKSDYGRHIRRKYSK